MRKIVSGTLLSLDGVMESLNQWLFPYIDEAIGAATAWKGNDMHHAS